MRYRPPVVTETSRLLALVPAMEVSVLLLAVVLLGLQPPTGEGYIQTLLPQVEAAAVAGAPEAAGRLSRSEIDIVLARQDGATAVYLQGARLPHGMDSLAAALDLLGRVAAETPNARYGVSLSADPAVAYRDVISAVDLCGRSGFGAVQFVLPAADGAESPSSDG